MDTGPGYETKREEAADNLIQLLKVPALAEIISKQGSDLVFRSIDHPYMQELADRLSANNPDGMKKIVEGLSGKAKAIVEHLSQEVQQLQSQLKETQADLKYSITKAHLAATVKAHDIEEINKTKRHDTEIRSHTALAVEEIKAGASLMNTHVEAMHHKAAAERIIESAEYAEKE